MPLTIDTFLRDRNLKGKDLGAACAPPIDEHRMSAYKTNAKGMSLHTMEVLVLAARQLCNDRTISLDDIAIVPGGLPKKTTKPMMAPPEPIVPSREILPGESLKEVIRAYVGESGEKLVPYMIQMAQGIHINVDGQQITVTPAEKKYATEWLSRYGEIGEDGELKETEVHILIQAEDGSELARLAAEEWPDWLKWKAHREAAEKAVDDALSTDSN